MTKIVSDNQRDAIQNRLLEALIPNVLEIAIGIDRCLYNVACARQGRVGTQGLG